MFRAGEQKLSGPDYRRMCYDITLAPLDNYVALLVHTPTSNMFPIASKIVSRAEWDAQAPRKRKEQKTPVEHIVITWTLTDPCFTEEECIKAVQKIQRDQIEKGESDIEYNFLIGGDGNLYEGRGWNTQSSYNKEIPETKKFVGNSIQVAFINKPSIKPTYKMLKAVATLFAIGDESKYVVKKVKYSRLLFNEVLSFTL